MEKLAGDDAFISFEGELQNFNLRSFEGASELETAVLKRNTIWPRQDFLIFPLKTSIGQMVLRAISGAVPRKILHIQIEKNGVLQFCAYDSFDPACLFWGPSLSAEFFESLVSDGILEPAKK
jgi:hypothetical protein